MRRIVLLRQQRRWSQSVLGHMVGLPQTTISALERGKINRHPGWIRRLALVLGWPPEEAKKLFEEVDDSGTVPDRA